MQPKFPIPIVTPLTLYLFTLKDSFAFAEEVPCSDSTPYMTSSDAESLFTNIPS